eukprot:9136320-Alexandrium_andersonii.AAC.1
MLTRSFSRLFLLEALAPPPPPPPLSRASSADCVGTSASPPTGSTARAPPWTPATSTTVRAG